MAELESCLQTINTLLEATAELQALAEQERWDDLLLVWPKYDKASDSLPVIDWEVISSIDQVQLKDKLQILQKQHEQLMNATLAWRTELQDILQSTVQSRRLNDTYR